MSAPSGFRANGTTLAARAMVMGIVFALAACGRGPAPVVTGSPQDAGATVATNTSTCTRANVLALRIDGRAWHADRAITAIMHPIGFDRMLMLSGSFGAKDRDEQTFNLNLAGVDRPGRYVIRGGNVAAGAIQLANLDATRYLAGGVLGADVVVDVRLFERSPLAIEVAFEGTLVANDGTLLRVEEGHFAYCE
ncbi:hypothetical protein [Dokdonella sp.]|uniref:hypothetical protein n=1 Tax=Dokdonella sp. TaxID=2291710 RepID=UPI003782EF27